MSNYTMGAFKPESSSGYVMQCDENTASLLDISELIDKFSMCRAGGYVRVAHPERPYMLSWGAVWTEACNDIIKDWLQPQQQCVGCDHGT